MKNARIEYFNEFEEIATYTAIETFAEAVGDETAKLAKHPARRERMAGFLERQIATLARAVAREEVPPASDGVPSEAPRGLKRGARRVPETHEPPA